MKASVAVNDYETAAPQGWTATMTGGGAPVWTLERDDSAPSRLVLKQASVPVYPLVLKDGTLIRDGFVSVKLKTVRGFRTHSGGVVWRAEDSQNYYLVSVDARDGNIVPYKVVDGRRTALDLAGRPGGRGLTVPVWAGRWHELRVRFAGNRFQVVFNGVSLFEVEDDTYADAGRIGLWTEADGVTLFDGFDYGKATV